ncbi:MAG: hydroxymethylpyrimidine/phosphomethylpyrimidine kinase [Herminiimonas sp.]|nr:hydroxymethylpyrimidine/phosphomethylpyrimidine kinase [Herminiimonas sp.]
MPGRPCVLVFAGTDPSGGAGIYADLQAIAAAGAHALPVVTVLTVQDNNRVHAIYPLPAEQVLAQAEALIATIPIAAVKIGIVGSRANALCIAALLTQLKIVQPDLPVVLDPVLASGHGDALTRGNALSVIAPLLQHATLITPNLPEASALCPDASGPEAQAAALIARGADHVLIKGGHGEADRIANRWFAADGTTRTWQSPRLHGQFHGSGCTLASAIAGRLAAGDTMHDAIDAGLGFCDRALAQAFTIAPGQAIPARSSVIFKEMK